MSQDFYKLLGVEKNATQSEVKKAYRRMANKYHPDKNKGDKAAEAKFKKISEAYETISDPQKRKMYDQFGSGGPQGAGFNAQGFASQFNGAENFADIFESFFGGGFSQSKSRPRKKSTAIPGEDIEKTIKISFKDSIFGIEQSIKYRQVTKCDLCSGSGVEPGHKLNTCQTCSGQGVVQEVRRSLLGQVMSTRTCTTCSGTGQVPEKKCSKCNGIKRHAVDRSLKVKVPKGIHDGAVIRITGAGNSGIGAPDGDLYVRVQVQSDKVFTRQGDDIHSDLDVPYWLAALGGEMSAETVYGQQVVKIPSGTQHGFTIPIKEKGAPSLRSETVGSHVFNVKIQIPKKLSSQEKKNLKEIKSSLTDTQKGFWK